MSLARADHEIRLTIADNGPGIDPAHAAEVARPFFTTKVDGSGLGLSVVRAVMEEHGGSFDIASDAGGTRVTLIFRDAGTAPTEGTWPTS